MRLHELTYLPKHSRAKPPEHAISPDSEEQANHLRWYAGHGYMPINAKLRGTNTPAGYDFGDSVDTDIQRAIPHMDKVIANAPKRKRTLKLYRGETDGDHGRRLLKMQPGQSFVDPGYVSTSIDASRAFYSFARRSDESVISLYLVPPSVPAVYMRISGEEDVEQEYVIGRGCTFTLKEKREIPVRNNRYPDLTVTLLIWSVKAPPKSVNEDYQGEHAPASKEGGAPLYDLTVEGIYPADVYGPLGYQYAPDTPQARSICLQYKGRPNRQIRIFRAVPADLVRPKINAGDWVTINRAYAKEHGESNLNNKYKIISKVVFARDLFTDGNSLEEWGYVPQPMVYRAEEEKIRASLGMRTFAEIAAERQAKAGVTESAEEGSPADLMTDELYAIMRQTGLSQHVSISTNETDDHTVDLITIRAMSKGAGYGSKAMDLLCRLADQHGVTVTLSPAADADDLERLVNWYAGYGFRGTYNRMKRAPR